MFTKIKALLSSIRFWLYTLGSASAYLGYIETNGFSWATLLTAVGGWLGVVGVTGGLDKWFSSKK